jgi:hypothetical protein
MRELLDSVGQIFLNGSREPRQSEAYPVPQTASTPNREDRVLDPSGQFLRTLWKLNMDLPFFFSFLA